MLAGQINDCLKQNPAYGSSFLFFSSPVGMRLKLFFSSLTFKVLWIVVLVNVLSIFGDTTIVPAALPRIVELSFNGNRTTQASTLRMYLANLGIGIGVTYDSVRIAEAKRKLLLTNLFYKVDFVPLVKEDGVHLYLMLQELGLFYYTPSGNLEYFVSTDEKDSWYKLSLGLTKLNFCGRMETFSVGLSGWRDRSLVLSWSKPLLPSTYYLGLGAVVRFFPEFNYPRERLVYAAGVSAGKDITLHSKAFLRLCPTYSKIDTLDAPRSHIKDIKEADASIGWTTDYRNNNFDPIKGWYFWNELMSNGLYSDDGFKFGQYSAEFRFYFPGFFHGNRIASRLQGCFRTNDAGPYRRLYTGGEGSVRGFPNYYLGMNGEMNNSLVLSTEYRFPILTVPEISLLSLFSNLFPEIKGLYYQIDGALIADAGHVWDHFTLPLHVRQNGAGIGVGIKILAPTMRRSICFDVVSPITKDLVSGKTTIYLPEYRLYLDAYY
jgi:outer membrane protein assembly factor BamA